MNENDAPRHPLVGVDPPQRQFFGRVQDLSLALWDSLRDPKHSNRLTAIGTLLIAAFTVILGCVSVFQGYQILTAKSDTQRLLAALERQALALSKAADEAEKQAIAAKDFSEAAKVQAAASLRSAGTGEEGLRATRASFEQEQRAWVGVVDHTLAELGPGKLYSVTATNTGRTPAVAAEFVTCYDALPVGVVPGVSYDTCARRSSEVVSQTVVLPNATLSNITPLTKITEPMVALVNNGVLTLYVYGKITYRDVFPGTPVHTTEFCTFYRLSTKKLSECGPQQGRQFAN